jgi:hypothetical protein
MKPIETYSSLMRTIRNRFDIIETLRQSELEANSFSKAETATFHGRKIIEAIAFACLVTVEHGLKVIPKDAKGQWNAEKIFKSLKAKKLNVMPRPSIFRKATESETIKSGAKITIEGVPEKQLTDEELIEIYQGFHAWLHEINPYTHEGVDKFYEEKSPNLWRDLERLHRFIERHFISIRGASFFCVLKDSKDFETKVIPLQKLSE